MTLLTLTAWLVLGAQARLNIDVIDLIDHRPLAEAAAKLQAMTGIIVNYEDIQYTAADLVDVSTPEQRAGSPGFHLMVPRRGAVKAAVPDAARGSLTETKAVAQALVDSYKAGGMPGDFQVEEHNGMIYVEPAKAPRMSTVVSVTNEPRRLIDCGAAILQAVSEASGVKIVAGQFPFFPPTPTACGATRQSARDALAAAFAAFSGAPGGYDLLFEPHSGYMLNVRFYSPRH